MGAQLPTAGDVISDYLKAQVDAIHSRQDALRADQPDAVHKTRVATRRLRSTLRSFRTIFHEDATDPLRAELKWYGEVLGGPRDAEVLRQRLVETLGTLPHDAVVGPVRERLKSELDAWHTRAHAELVKAMNSTRHRELLNALTELATAPPTRPVADEPFRRVLDPLLKKATQRVVKRWRATQAAEPGAQMELAHETRKKAKAARYAFEALAKTNQRYVTGAKAWEQVTEALGTAQDSVVACTHLKELAMAARSAGEPSFTYGALYMRELTQQGDAHDTATLAISKAQEASRAALAEEKP
ncbi:CHAD domain-containing protein [Kocuria sp.]|uniref:CHAD domain-containing protein n=1 Tax=Kocuria sp. TaxID=1871328 RepID=UPI0026DF050B|nr:CHAD domain-containing protein [Kocuria sp.]MDO5617234.1 CHAD domain-containing protein [Kocuria sp.]